MKSYFSSLVLRIFVLLTLVLVGCQPHKGAEVAPVSSVFVFNEGQFMASNASLSSYDPMAKTVSADIFASANNGALLGDTPSSATMFDGKLYVTLSGSGKIYVLDPASGKLLSKITELDSPRYIYILNHEKGYVSNINKSSITIFNPSTGEITGEIKTPTAAEMLVRVGDYLYSNLWSYGNQVIKIDMEADKIVGQIKVGVQPVSLVADVNEKLWVLCDGGGWPENPIGFEKPSMIKINAEDMTIAQRWTMPEIPAFSLRLIVDHSGENLYYLFNGVYRMSVVATQLPAAPLVSMPDGVTAYGLGLNPQNNEIYVSDAVDYTQNGKVYRFEGQNGQKLDAFSVGIVPAFFSFL